MSFNVLVRSRNGGWLRRSREATRARALKRARELARATGQQTAISPAASPSKTRANPSSAQVARAAHRVETFTGKPARRVREVPGDLGDTLAKLARVSAIEYESDKYDGKRRRYRHEFEKPAYLACDPRGRFLVIYGRHIRVTARGIEG